MNARNQELIVDLLGGRLSPEEERTALARIENDPVFRAEYETQLSAISILEASPTPSMTPAERSSLHAALRQQLFLDDAPVPVVATPSRWQRWRAPLGGLAVAAAVIVGAVVVLPGTLSGDDSGEDVAMLAAEISTTVPSTSRADDFAGHIQSGDTGTESADTASPETTEFTTSVPNASLDEDFADEADAAPPPPSESVIDGEDAADEEAQPTTTAATSDVVIAPISLPYLSDVDLDALEQQLASDPDSLENDASAPSTMSAELDASRVDACLDSLRSDETVSSLTPIATTTYEGTGAVVVSVSPPEGDSFLAIFAVDVCRELANTQG